VTFLLFCQDVIRQYLEQPHFSFHLSNQFANNCSIHLRFIVVSLFQRLLVNTSWHRLLSDGHIVLIAGAIWLSTSTMAILEPCLPIWLMDNIKPQVNGPLPTGLTIMKQMCRPNKVTKIATFSWPLSRELFQALFPHCMCFIAEHRNMKQQRNTVSMQALFEQFLVVMSYK
jgi:hypothetical protein